MSLVRSIAGLFKWCQFEPEVILLVVGWYLRFSLSYRDVEELLAERGISVDHVTLWRSRAAIRPGTGATPAQTPPSPVDESDVPTERRNGVSSTERWIQRRNP